MSEGTYCHVVAHTISCVLATLTVRLQDVNDNPPEFENTNYTFTVSENAQNPSIIATLQAQDKDVNRTITYSLGPEPMSFTIDSQTGKQSAASFDFIPFELEFIQHNSVVL